MRYIFSIFLMLQYSHSTWSAMNDDDGFACRGSFCPKACTVCWEESAMVDKETLMIKRPDLYGCDFSTSLPKLNLTMLTMPFVSSEIIFEEFNPQLQGHRGLAEPIDRLDEERDWVQRLIDDPAALCTGAREGGGHCHAALVRSYLRGLTLAGAALRFNPDIRAAIASGAAMLAAGRPHDAATSALWVVCDEEALRQACAQARCGEASFGGALGNCEPDSTPDSRTDQTPDRMRMYLYDPMPDPMRMYLYDPMPDPMRIYLHDQMPACKCICIIRRLIRCRRRRRSRSSAASGAAAASSSPVSIIIDNNNS